MIYTYPLPRNFNSTLDDSGTIHYWLEHNGCSVNSVSMVTFDDAPMLEIESEVNPAPYLETFPETKTQNEQITKALDALNLDDPDELKTAVMLLRAALNV